MEMNIMEKYQDKGLVSIIMLSHGDGTYVVETVRSVLAQTYQNWELLYVAQTNDETLEPLSSLREEQTRLEKLYNVPSLTLFIAGMTKA